MKKVLYLLFSLLLILFFLAPALLNYDKMSFNDWDLELANHYSHFKSFFQYKQIMLWSPWICGGKPGLTLTGLREVGFTVLLGSIFPFLLAHKLTIAWHFFLAFFGFYLFSTRVVGNRNPIAPFLVSMLFVFNGSMIKHLEEGHLVFLPVCLFPLIFSLLEMSFKEKRPLYILMASFVTTSLFYSGTTYPLVHLFCLFVIYFLFKFSFESNRKQVLLYGTIFALSTLLLSSVKILLTYDYLKQYPKNRTRELLEHLPLHAVWRSLISPTPHSIGKWRWHERSFYIGGSGTLLFLISLFILFPIRLLKKRVQTVELAFLFSAFLSFLMILGSYSKYSLYTFSYKLPILNSMHVTGRWFFPFITSSCFFLLFSLKEIESKEFTGSSKRKLLFLSQFFFLITLGSALFFELYTSQRESVQNFAHKQVPWSEELDKLPKLSSHKEHFEVIKTPSLYDFGSRSSLLPMVINNKASRKCYAPLFKGPRAIIPGKDIVFLVEEKGFSEISHISFSPNKIAFDADLTKEETIQLNQNYSPYWYLYGHQVKQVNQKPAITLPPGSYKNLTFYYWPKYLSLGLFLVFCGILLSAFVIWQDKKRLKQSHEGFNKSF